MTEIPIENLAAAIAARLDCPVCDGKVRLMLGTNGPGDLPVWACNSCNSQWHENGKPRYSIELAVDIAMEATGE